MKILHENNELEIKSHPGVDLPYCPNCGKKLFCLWNEGRPLSVTIDFILFCNNCETFWYSNGAYFQLKKIIPKNWGLKIKRY